MGNGFPGLAIFSVIALLVALGLAALISLHPWAASSVAPQLSTAPGLGIALDDSVLVAPARGADVAEARVAGAPRAAVAEKPVATRETGSVPELAIAQARPVARPAPASPPVRPPAPPSPEPVVQPQPLPQPAPVAAPVAVPVAAPSPASPTAVVTSPGSKPAGPIGAGVGPGGSDPAEAISVEEGDEYAFSFSFYAQPTVYRLPGLDNLIMQFSDEASEDPSFGLQLWDDGSGSERGLWSSGDAMDGERFLAPLAEGVWHEVAVYFRASSEGGGFYLVFLDGQPIDVRVGVSLIDPDSSSAQIEAGLFRDGERVEGSSEILFGPVRLGDSVEPVLP